MESADGVDVDDEAGVVGYFVGDVTGATLELTTAGRESVSITVSGRFHKNLD